MSTAALRGSRTLVTGGAGFIGSHLCEALLDTGAHVRILDDLSTGRMENLVHCAESVDWIEGDIRDLETCRKACAGIDLVFHQAALGSVPRSLESPGATIAINVAGTANVFAAARETGVARIVYASSSSVYGDADRLPWREGEEGLPLSPYALSKKMCEELAGQFARSFGTELIGLRYFNVFGPRQDPEGPYAAVVPSFFAAAMRSKAPLVFGDGEQSRDFTPIVDAVRANLLAASADSRATGSAYNVATGQRTTINSLARLIGELVGIRGSTRHAPAREGDVLHSQADLAHAEEMLRYRPSSSLEQGLADSLDYYRSLFP
jgi:nucleoside-diphosphate-sugar epimerase